ncbi:leucine rich repeat variant [Calothrix sp. NIES-4071]|nr:leucine rich repeat variant [Calothrix sp. NIES-4071]BAZ63505.1 leucine rich repeat variant [Calothrix sp. NIES-4105]
MQLRPLEEVLDSSTPVERLQELASYDNTPAECLCLLVKSCYKGVVEAVAQNPNTPPRILEELFCQYPVEVLNNSALQLLILETPNLLDKFVPVDHPNCDLIFEFDNLPDLFINWAISHQNKQIRFYVAKSSKTELKYLGLLARDQDESVRLTVALNPTTPSRLSNIILEQLAFSSDFAIRCCVARETKNLRILNKLALDKHIHVRCEVAENKFAPPNALKLLSIDTNKNVLRLVAENHNTPDYVLEILAQDKYEIILLAVAKNPNTPSHVLQQLAQHSWFDIRQSVAAHKNVDGSILKKLSQDESKNVRLAAVENLKRKRA